MVQHNFRCHVVIMWNCIGVLWSYCTATMIQVVIFGTAHCSTAGVGIGGPHVIQLPFGHNVLLHTCRCFAVVLHSYMNQMFIYGCNCHEVIIKHLSATYVNWSSCGTPQLQRQCGQYVFMLWYRTPAHVVLSSCGNENLLVYVVIIWYYTASCVIRLLWCTAQLKIYVVTM